MEKFEKEGFENKEKLILKKFECPYGTVEAKKVNEYWVIVARDTGSKTLESAIEGMRVVASKVEIKPLDGSNDKFETITVSGDLPDGWVDFDSQLDGYVLDVSGKN